MSPGDVTVLLQQLGSETGAVRKQIFDQLVTIVYEELRGRAHYQMAAENYGHTLTPTALVHEAYERLLGYQMTFENRAHFLNVAAHAMRRLLIDHARRVRTSKRGNDQQAVPLREDLALSSYEPETVIAIDEAMNTLRPDQIQLVELRYFAGLTLGETAGLMKIEPETLKKRWQVVKILLYDKLKNRQK
jgi:RNA polymerase sigma factor (TIGR02999 family)